MTEFHPLCTMYGKDILMKKLLTWAMLVALLLTALTLPAMAEGEDGATDSVDNYTALTHHGTEYPEEFENAEFWDFFWYTDGVGLHENFFTSADGLTAFEYVYMKAYEGEDKSTAFPAEEAYISVDFEVEEAGTYDFLIEVMAFETYIPRTGLIQIDDGEKYYLSATHNTNHETFEYFSGLSAYLTLGEHRITIYLAPDFDDASVKSLFFDNFYFMLREGGDAPDLPVETEPEDPNAPPMWFDNKDVVKHLSFDELRTDSGDGIFTPGASGSWNKVAEIDSDVNTLSFWGWVALADEIGTFGYQIDGGEPIYNDSYTVEAEGPVVDAAVAQGGTAASRMLIDVDVSALEGEHKVRILYKDLADQVVALSEFKVKRDATPVDPVPTETTPETQPETTPATVPETIPETSAESVAATVADTTAETKPAEGGCASSVMALPMLVGAIAAAYALRRRED